MPVDNSYDILIGILLVFGVLFTFFPKLVVKINSLGNSILFRDEDLFKYPRTLGLVLTIIGCIIFFDLWILK